MCYVDGHIMYVICGINSIKREKKQRYHRAQFSYPVVIKLTLIYIDINHIVIN